MRARSESLARGARQREREGREGRKEGESGVMSDEEGEISEGWRKLDDSDGGRGERRSAVGIRRDRIVMCMQGGKGKAARNLGMRGWEKPMVTVGRGNATIRWWGIMAVVVTVMVVVNPGIARVFGRYTRRERERGGGEGGDPVTDSETTARWPLALHS